MAPRTRLRVLRAERDLSQMDTAEKAAIALNRYWKIENGYLDPTPAERRRLARVFRVAVGQLFPPMKVEPTRG